MVRLCLLFLLSFTLNLAAPLIMTPPPILASLTASTASNAPQALFQQGITLYKAERYFEAAQRWRQASLSFAAQNDPLGQALTLNHLSLAYQRLGQLEQADRSLNESLQIFESFDQLGASSEQVEIYAKVLNTQGKLRWLQGRLEDALASWRASTQFYSQAGTEDGAAIAQINQARALQALGLNHQAEVVLRQVYQQVQQQPNPDLQATGYRRLAEVLRQVGDLKTARDLLQTSFSLATRPKNTSLIFLELGNTEWAMGDRLNAIGRQTAAQTHLQAAQTAYQQAIDIDQPLQARLNLLSLLISTGQTTEAIQQLPTIEQTLAGSPPSRTTVYARINLAESLMQLAQAPTEKLVSSTQNIVLIDSSRVSPTAIAQLLSTAIQEAQILQDSQAESYGLGQLGALYEQMGQWKDAQALTQQALLKLETLQVPEIRYRWEWQLGRLLQQQGDQAEAIRVYEAAVNSLQRVRNDLLNVNADIQFSFRDNVEPVYRQYVELLLNSDQTARPQTQQLEQAIQTIDQLQLAELENYLGCTLAQVRSVDQVQDPNTAIIYPILLSDRLAIVAQMPGASGGLIYRQALIPQVTVEATLSALQRNLSAPGRTPEVIKDAKTVYDWLIRPLETDLAQASVKTLAFVLDGSLRNIPMSVLHDGEQYLIEKGYAVAIAPRLQIFNPDSSDSPLKVTVGGVGIPQVINGAEFPPIAKLREEFEGIAQYVEVSDFLVDESFTTQNIRQQLQTGEFSAIHWKTHGVFSSDPQETYIVAYNEQIIARELNDLIGLGSQDGARPLELLVLSACETAQGDNRAVLGLAGLAARTGTRSVLSTLWIAQDTPNTVFMSRFYRALTQSRMTKAEALRQAQLDLIREYGYTTPYIWSNYVLIGNWL
ncbi:MAG: CHAT domain-containing protein [Leptolyngbyaceae cyanobacterium MO_188.B28]|nr:CHAT domain-containing protein [Leptolyngbyaceae cyanobacterium MO_188.B28]